MAFSSSRHFFSDPPTLTGCARASRRFHRKTLLYISGLGMAVFIFIAAILVRRMDGFSSAHRFLNAPKVEANGGHHSADSYHEVLLLTSILCYNSFSASGVMILPWTLISELYPIQVR
jgi:MFS family permease